MALLDWIATNMPWTPIGRSVNEQKYRGILSQQHQQEWDMKQEQLKAAQQAFKPGAPHPEQIPVTPMVGSPGYDQARQQLDQTQIGTASPVDYLKGPQSQIAQGLASAGQFGQAAQLLVNNAPQEKFQNFTPQNDPLGMGGAGQIDPSNNQISNYVRPQQGPAGKDAFQQMTPEQLKQWGFPEGTVAALNTVTGKPDVIYRPDLRESADLQARTQQGGTFALPSGDIVAGEFTPNGGYGYRDAQNKLVPLPPGSRPTVPSAGGFLSPKDFLAKRNELLQEQQALQRLNNYGKSVGGMNVGIKNWADSVTAKFRTMLGSKELNPAEFARMTGEGQLQALLGLFRTDVVGPGVMTEFDAQRVLQALGGNIGMLQNPQVVQKLLSDLYQDKMQRAQLLEMEINRNAPVFNAPPMQINAPDEFVGTGAPQPDGQPDKDGWVTLPNGTRIREKR